MDAPRMLGARKVAPDTHALLAYLPVPPAAVLPINAFVLHAAQPVLVDTSFAGVRDDFLRALRATTDLGALRWIWLTHADADHTGSLLQVLQEAPNARIATTFIGWAKLALQGFPVDRVQMVNPGQSLDVGDRQLVAVKPPTYDAPETTGFLDTKTRVLFSADCFGALLAEPAEDARTIAPGALIEGLTTWATIDAPWLGLVHADRFGESLQAIHRLDASVVLSAHLPPAPGMARTLLEHLKKAQSAPAFVGPDQAAFEQMLKGTPVGAK
jgi:glyoxylase-like metal-dependent hydrolase (beta-lactamase superfamily II)